MADTFFQQWLDHVGGAFFVDRFDIYRAAIHLPLEITSTEDVKIIHDEAALRALFDSWVQMLKLQRATDMVRVARQVEWMSPTMICGDYYTEILSNGQRIMDRFSSSMILQRHDNTWQATHVATGITRDAWPPIIAHAKAEDAFRIPPQADSTDL